MAGIRYVPFAAVVVVRDVPVSTWVAVIATPGRTPPLSSVIVPRSSPWASWPRTGEEQSARNATRETANRNFIESSEIWVATGQLRRTADDKSNASWSALQNRKRQSTQKPQNSQKSVGSACSAGSALYVVCNFATMERRNERKREASR